MTAPTPADPAAESAQHSLGDMGSASAPAVTSTSAPEDGPAHGRDRRVDLVMEGGGVKGIALAGALEVLEERGYRVHRVAGSSAGAIAGALSVSGVPARTIVEILRATDYRKFEDELAAHGRPGSTGTFADLALPDPEIAVGPSDPRLHRLVVTASDLSAGRLRLLPQDAGAFGRDPARLRVADAVRVSSSIPLFFRPVGWRTTEGGTAVLVDGGMLSNFPVSVFDRPAGEVPRWPTFGIKLSAKPEADFGMRNRIRGPLSFGKAVVDTVTGFYDRMHIDAQHAVERTIFIDTAAVRPTQFDLSEDEREVLYRKGRKAATDFLDGDDEQEPWDFARHIARHRGGGAG
jgi:NTE family protein